MATFETGCSFDHLTTTELLEEFIERTDATVSAVGRNSTNGLRVPNQSNDFVIKAVSTAATKCIGFAYRCATLPSALAIAIFKDTSTVHVDLRVTSGGKLRVTRAGTQLGSDGTATLMTGQFYYIEFKATIHDSTGTIDVKVNGVSDISLTGQDTRNGGNASINQVVLGNDQGGASVTINSDYDDFYVADDFLGELRGFYSAPNGNGNSSQLVGSDGNSTDNYLLTDDASPDDDTTYVESSTTDQKDTYAMTNLPSTASTVHAVMVVANARKDDAGSRSIALVARSGSNETDSPDKTLNTTYGYFEHAFTTKPGGGAWSSSDVDAMEIGVKVRP
jgi:hypothetical protein